MKFFYLICIEPIEYLLDIASYLLYDIFNSESVVIICLAILVNAVTSPLYKAANDISRIQCEQKKDLSYWEKLIKIKFDGDERFARLSTFYREKNYNIAFSAIKEILPLILQIPFFTAAYVFILNSGLLDNATFFSLEDLTVPDGILCIKGIEVNILPILMTVINIISSIIYLKGKNVREYIQSFTLAFFFLIVLYGSPSGLVIYWLTNNIYSLFRNLIYRYVSDSHRIVLFLSFVPVVAYFLWDFVLAGNRGVFSSHNGIFFVLIAIPLYYIYSVYFKNRVTKSLAVSANQKHPKGRVYIFLSIILLLVFYALLLGGIIPLELICSSPSDFIHIYNFHNPLQYVYVNLGIYLGTALWGGIFSWLLFDEKGLNNLYVVMLVVSLFAVLQYIFMGKNYGVISEELVYDFLIIQNKEKLISGFMLIVVVCLCIVTQKYRKFWNVVVCGAVMAEMIYGGVRWNSINGTVSEFAEISAKYDDDSGKLEGIYRLSSDKENVVVIMLDRAIGAMLPYVMAEKPILRDKLAGFTYYPDTLSFGARTNRAAAALFGGYEYSMELTNARKDKSTKEKFSEALNMLPRLFLANGYEVTVADLPYLNEEGMPTVESFNSYEGMKGYILEGRYSYLVSDDYQVEKHETVQRRFYMYSIFRTTPSFCANVTYGGGDYLHYRNKENNLKESFLDAYMVLDVLPEITVVDNNIPGQFIMFTNNTTHSPCYLQMPEYEPKIEVDNSAYERNITTVIDGRRMELDTLIQRQHFEVNVAALLKLGEYFDYMRECGVYDNTRIIIVSDHGEPLGQFADMIYMEGELDAEALNPLLLVKDFNATEFKVSDELMTNADVPLLATRGIVNSPVNPYTGSILSDDYKKGDMLVSPGIDICFPFGSGYDDGGGGWYRVHDSIFDEDNWSRADYK